MKQQQSKRSKTRNNPPVPDVQKPKLDYSAKPLTKNQQLYQTAIESSTVTFATGPAGTGKAQPLYSKVLTINGWKYMADIQVGDIVRSTDDWTTVTGVFPQEEQKEIVRFHFRDGSTVDSSIDHLWYVNNGITNKGTKRDTSKQEVLTTKGIINLLDIKTKGNISISVPEPIPYPEKSLFIPPYTLGFLLGDGCMTSTLSFTTSDTEVVDYIKNELPEGITVTQHKSIITYGISDKQSTWKKPNRYIASLKELGLYGKLSQHKFIPEEYLNTSIEQRYELLQGLCDSDGTVAKSNGNISYCTTSQQLAENIKTLVLSLGGVASISTSKKYFTYKGTKKQGLLAYIVSINLKDKTKAFKLQRKKDLVSNTDIKQLRRIITSYEYLGKQECKCISVAHHTRLYITDDYILTHNTYTAVAKACEYLETGRVRQIILTRPLQDSEDDKLGILPGEIDDKFGPYIAPMIQLLEQFLGKSKVEAYIKAQKIVGIPLALVRGHTFDNAFIIASEMQNSTPTTMKLILTRIGKYSKVVIDGDIRQKDIHGKSGIEDAMDKLDSLPGISFICFTIDDIVRSDIVRDILIRYET